jgi:hypothetical protein
LVKIYRSRKSEVRALDGLDLTVAEGVPDADRPRRRAGGGWREGRGQSWIGEDEVTTATPTRLTHGGLRQEVADGLVMMWRNLKRVPRIPALRIELTIIWAIVLVAIFAPLGVWRYRSMSR